MNKKYLSELLTNTEFESNNLILSPVGSGKTSFVINDLVPSYEKILYLCDTSALRDQVTEDMKEINNVTIMCYQSFGGEIITSNNYITDNAFDCIVADEFHNLFAYDRTFQSKNTSHAIKTLLQYDENITKFYLTATPYEYFSAQNEDHSNAFSHVKKYDFLDNKEVVSYTNKKVRELNSFREIANTIESISNHMLLDKKKVLIFAEKIDTLQKISDDIANLDIDYITPICLWSVNNKTKPMNDEQIRVRDYLLENGEIPDEYNVLIINKSMETGINIEDDAFTYCFINSNNPTTRTQARGRLRHNIECLWTIKSGSDPEVKVEAKNKHFIRDYIGIKLTSKEKNEICNKFNIIDKFGRKRGWNTIKRTITRDMGYTITNKTTRIDGKNVKVAIIQ